MGKEEAPSIVLEADESEGGPSAIASLLEEADISKSIDPMTASCYLYYDDGGRLVHGPRVQDPTTATIESMTREAFVCYRDHKVDADAQRFMEDIRHAILSQNEHGEWLKHGISPAVLTDDWVLRATEFVQLVKVCNDHDYQHARSIRLDMAEKRIGLFVEGWLVVKFEGIPDDKQRQAPLPLVMFSKKYRDEFLLECLDKVLEAVHPVMVATFPDNLVSPLQRAHDLWDASSHVCELEIGRSSGCGNDIREAFEKCRALRARGVGGGELKAEMQTFRAFKKARLAVKRDHAVGIGGGPLKNETRGAATQRKTVLPSEETTMKPTLNTAGFPADEENQITACSSGPAKKEALLKRKPRHLDCSVTGPYFWRGLLAAAALYYVYVLMRG